MSDESETDAFFELSRELMNNFETITISHFCKKSSLAAVRVAAEQNDVEVIEVRHSPVICLVKIRGRRRKTAEYQIALKKMLSDD